MDITIVIERFRPESAHDAETWKLHEQRSELIRSLVNSLDLELKGWNDTDQNGWPREIAEVIVVLGSSSILTAMLTAFKIWIDRKKIKAVSIKKPDGSIINIEGATINDIGKIAKELGLNFDCYKG